MVSQAKRGKMGLVTLEITYRALFVLTKAHKETPQHVLFVFDLFQLGQSPLNALLKFKHFNPNLMSNCRESVVVLHAVTFFPPVLPDNPKGLKKSSFCKHHQSQLTSKNF